MTTVVATHAVGDLDTWLAGGDDRKQLFSQFCRSHRIFTHPDRREVAIVFEDVDLQRMHDVLGAPDTVVPKTKHTVIDPVTIFIEVRGGS